MSMVASTRPARMTLVCIACIVLMGLGCGSNPRNVKITDQNLDSFMEEIKGMSGLTVEETGLLMAYMARYGIAKELAPEEAAKISPVGLTVGEVIDKQRTWKEAEDARQAEKERIRAEQEAKAEALAAKAREEEEARQATMRDALTVAVVRKGYLSSDALKGRYRDLITMDLSYENHADKTIRAFSGEIAWKDLFGDEIMTTNIKISDPVGPGKTRRWSGSLDYNQFVDGHTRLRAAELDDMKVEWIPRTIIFADGTTLEAGEGGS